MKISNVLQEGFLQLLMDTSVSNPKLTQTPLTLDACYLRHLDAREQVNCSTILIESYLKTLNEIIQDTDNEIGRLRQGREISRARKKKHKN